MAGGMDETALRASELLDVDVQREMAPHGGDVTHFGGGETGRCRRWTRLFRGRFRELSPILGKGA